MRPFGRTSGTLRAVAALVSVALTAAVFSLLRATSSPPAPKRIERQVTVAIFPPRAIPPRAVAEPPPTLAARPGGRRVAPAARVQAPAPAPERVATPEPAAAPAGLAAAAPAPATPASAALRLDAKTIGRAIATSEGNVRQMARRSGEELDSPRPSRSEALAGAVADRGVPDCLAPNAGGSLLSVPFLLVLAAQGKCK